MRYHRRWNYCLVQQMPQNVRQHSGLDFPACTMRVHRRSSSVVGSHPVPKSCLSQNHSPNPCIHRTINITDRTNHCFNSSLIKPAASNARVHTGDSARPDESQPSAAQTALPSPIIYQAEWDHITQTHACVVLA